MLEDVVLQYAVATGFVLAIAVVAVASVRHFMKRRGAKLYAQSEEARRAKGQQRTHVPEEDTTVLPKFGSTSSSFVHHYNGPRD